MLGGLVQASCARCPAKGVRDVSSLLGVTCVRSRISLDPPVCCQKGIPGHPRRRRLTPRQGRAPNRAIHTPCHRTSARPPSSHHEATAPVRTTAAEPRRSSYSTSAGRRAARTTRATPDRTEAPGERPPPDAPSWTASTREPSTPGPSGHAPRRRARPWQGTTTSTGDRRPIFRPERATPKGDDED